MFMLQLGKEFIIIVVVVDDMSFISNSTQLMELLKSRMKSAFVVKLFGKLQTFIGWEIDIHDSCITATQSEYVRDMLEKCRMSTLNAVWAFEYDELLNNSEHSEYRSIIGALIHLSVCARPDITFAVTMRHHKLLKRLLRYLAGTITNGILFPSSTIAPASL